MIGVMILSRHKTVKSALRIAKRHKNTFIVQGKGILLVLAMIQDRSNIYRKAYGDFSSVNSSVPHLY